MFFSALQNSGLVSIFTKGNTTVRHCNLFQLIPKKQNVVMVVSDRFERENTAKIKYTAYVHKKLLAPIFEGDLSLGHQIEIKQ